MTQNNAQSESRLLPSVLQGELDDEQLQQLLLDLRTCAEVQHVQARLKCSHDAPPEDRRITLDELEDLFRHETITTAQIRYRYQDQNWCDTLLVRDGAVRLVRMQQDQIPNPIEE